MKNIMKDDLNSSSKETINREKNGPSQITQTMTLDEICKLETLNDSKMKLNNSNNESPRFKSIVKSTGKHS